MPTVDKRATRGTARRLERPPTLPTGLPTLEPGGPQPLAGLSCRKPHVRAVHDDQSRRSVVQLLWEPGTFGGSGPADIGAAVGAHEADAPNPDHEEAAEGVASRYAPRVAVQLVNSHESAGLPLGGEVGQEDAQQRGVVPVPAMLARHHAVVQPNLVRRELEAEADVLVVSGATPGVPEQLAVLHLDAGSVSACKTSLDDARRMTEGAEQIDVAMRRQRTSVRAPGATPQEGRRS